MSNLSGSLHGKKVGIIGAGSIGVGWALVFARAGLEVAVFEPDETRGSALREDVLARLLELDAHGLLEEEPQTIVGRVFRVGDMSEAVSGAIHVQECTPESLEVKQAVFDEIDGLVAGETSVASSSSALTISQIVSRLSDRGRYLVAHPGNPPYLLKVVEIAAGDHTDRGVAQSVTRLMQAVGMVPVEVGVEVEGLVFNRLQGAILREAYCLVRDGVISPEDLDRVVTEGLGKRWSVIGPFATAHLNTRGGIRAHASRMGAAYARMGADRGQDDPWTPELVELVARSIEAKYPLEFWEEAVLWRDLQLMGANSVSAGGADGDAIGPFVTGGPGTSEALRPSTTRRGLEGDANSDKPV